MSAASCVTPGCEGRAARLSLHCAECEREIVGAIEATHGPLVGSTDADQPDLFGAAPTPCPCGRTPARYHSDLRRVACGVCAARERGA